MKIRFPETVLDILKTSSNSLTVIIFLALTIGKVSRKHIFCKLKQNVCFKTNNILRRYIQNDKTKIDGSKISAVYKLTCG